MSGQYFGERVNASDISEKTDKVNDFPVNLNVATDRPLQYEAPVQAAPLGDAVVMDSPHLGEKSAYQTPVQETPLVGTQDMVYAKDEVIVNKIPVAETIENNPPPSANTETLAALLNQDESEIFRTRWSEIQAKFVDEPRTAVQQADTLVSEVVNQITQVFTKEHNSLESQWNQGKNVSTEDLRMVFQHYRSFFNLLVVKK